MPSLVNSSILQSVDNVKMFRTSIGSGQMTQAILVIQITFLRGQVGLVHVGLVHEKIIQINHMRL